MHRRGYVALALLLYCCSRPSRASEKSSPMPTAEPPSGGVAGWFILGATTALFAHESAHLIALWAYGNQPKPQVIWAAGFVPFFSLTHPISCRDDVCVDTEGQNFSSGRRRNFEIWSAGFQMQLLLNEAVLRARPDLRYRSAPFLKGAFAFNTFLAVLYVAGALTTLEPSSGDIAGQARLSGWPRAALAGALLVPTALDVYRYFRPRSMWAPWAALSSKAGYGGLIFAF